MTPIKVAIVEDNKDIRIGLSYILKSAQSYNVLADFEKAESMLYFLEENHVDVILMDIELPGMTGIEATSIIKKKYPEIQIVILSIFEDDENVFQAICAGASGYVAKPVMPEKVFEVVDQAFLGASPMSPHIARKVLEMFKQHIPPESADYNLTPRELEVLDMLISGLNNKMIAEKMFLSTFTVKAHIRNIYDKLHVHSKSQAVAKALSERIISKR